MTDEEYLRASKITCRVDFIIEGLKGVFLKEYPYGIPTHQLEQAHEVLTEAIALTRELQNLRGDDEE